MACTGSVSYGMMPTCAGYTTVNKKRQYAGKVRFDDLSRFDLVGNVDGQCVYTALVNSPTFKCMLRIVYVVREEKGKIYTALLFGTDTDCAALDILRYYRARFQIEFYSAMPTTHWTVRLPSYFRRKAGVPFQCFTGSTESASSGRPAAGRGRRRPQRHFHRQLENP
jgi:hypothetical protein